MAPSRSDFARVFMLCSLALAIALGGCGEETTSTADATSADSAGLGDVNADSISTGDTIAADTGGSGADTAGADGQLSDLGDGAAGDGAAGDAAADGSGAKYPTCVDVGQCVSLSCGNTPTVGCEKPCLAGASEAALQLAVPLLGCYQGNCLEGQCKGSKDGGCVDNCMKSACLPELLTCLDSGATGTKACATVSTCFDACSLGDKNGFACLATCYNGMDAKGKAAAKAIGACFAKAPQGQDPSKFCAKEMVDCIVGDASGPKECFEIFPCMETCKDTGGDDFQCTMQCLGQVTKPGQAAFLNMIDCLGGSSITPQCQDKFLACINPTGSGDCYGGITCIGACEKASGGKKDSPDCLFKCAHAMSKPAATEFLAASQCFGGGGTPEQQQVCTGKLVKCIGATGTATCADTIGCVQACPKDDGPCMYGCIKKASSATATEAWSVIQCGSGGDTSKCLPIIGACYGKGTQTCAQVLSCAAACNGKPECANACLGKGTVSSATQAFKALQCFGKNDPTCIGDVTTCIGPVGAKSCTELSSCLFTQCNGKTGQDAFACQYSCLAQGSTTSVNDFFAWDSCNKTCSAQCPSGGDGSPAACMANCFQSKCPAAQQACAPKT